MRQSYATRDAVSVVHDTEYGFIDASGWQTIHSETVAWRNRKQSMCDGTEWLKLDGGVTTGCCGRGG